jgi:phage terminase large subunit-like protein
LNEVERELYALKLQKLEQLENQERLKIALPHRYAQKHYPWSREYYDNLVDKVQCCTAANQIGKSTVNIKKCIEWCVNKELWPSLWPVQMGEGAVPSMFWYLYPDKVLATAEFEDKWRPLLPGDPDHPEYGYRIWKRNQQIERIDWKSGISLHFKVYAQDVQALQGGTVWAMFCDEEVPVALLPELQTRVSATDGFIHFVFTATLGQTFWRDVVERRTQWPHAKVWQISLYDCMKFEDGTPTRWTKEKIQRAIDACVSPAEVQRRVFGKFVKDEGLKYQTFDRERHFVPYVKPPADWIYIGGADYGSGGKNHPSAVTIVAISPDFTKGCVVRHWRGDNLITTSEDVVLKCVEMSRGLEVRTWYYDYSAKDLATYAQNAGLPFETAEKSHAIGEGALNTLFKSGSFVLMMPNEEYEKDVPSGEYLETYKMADEFESLAVETNKTKAKDDSIDSCRYAIAKIGWNWEMMNDSLAARRKKAPARVKSEQELRREYILGDGKDVAELSMEEEIDEWNELMEL